MNSQLTIAVAAKVLGKRQPIFSDWHIPISFSTDQLPLQDLLTAIVTAEVVAFNERQQARRLTRVMSSAQIATEATMGKVDAGAHDETQVASLEDAIATALQAFTDHLYYVFVDDVQYDTLEQLVPLHQNSRVMFVRLVALVGG
jgi:hypothetical protein